MTETIMIAVLSLVGTAVGTFGGILTANKLVNYRIEQLEKKVDKHNNVVERMYKVEKAVDIIDTRVKVSEHRINDLEEK